ncbi:MAG: porin family protein [Flavipsychrobacter sp.]|nr:porin family protein [Flavipsychrobacter sp.]
MKHILLSALLVASLPALAQTEKGKIMVGVSLADISAGIVKGGSAVDYVSLTINPRVGYFVADNLVIGTALNLGLGKSHDFTVLNYAAQNF